MNKDLYNQLTSDGMTDQEAQNHIQDFHEKLDSYLQEKRMTEEQNEDENYFVLSGIENEILDEKEFMADGLPYYSLDDHPDQPIYIDGEFIY